MRSCPANVAALHSPAFTEPGKFPRNSQVFDQVIRRADPMPSAPGWPDVVSQTQPLLDRMFYAPVLDLDTLLPRIDELSAALLARPDRLSRRRRTGRLSRLGRELGAPSDGRPARAHAGSAGSRIASVSRPVVSSTCQAGRRGRRAGRRPTP